MNHKLAIYDRAAALGCQFVATGPLDASAATFWRAAALGFVRKGDFYPSDFAELKGLKSPFASALRLQGPVLGVL